MKINIKKYDLFLAKKCFSLTELSELSGVGKKTLRKIGTGKDVRPSTIGAVAKAFQVDVTELIED